MLELLDDVHIVTDAEEMESLYMKARSTVNNDEKAATFKKAFELYQGRLFELDELDMGSWLIPYTTHYNQVFIKFMGSGTNVEIAHRQNGGGFFWLVENRMEL